MSRRRGSIETDTPSKPGRTDARKPILETLAPWLGATFIGLCVALIPYGATFSREYGFAMLAACLGTLLCSRRAPQIWQRLTFWPMILVLVAYAVGCAASVDQPRSLARFAGMPLFAMLFVAVQVTTVDRRALRVMAWACVGAMVVIAIDVALARFAQRSLFHGEVVATTRTAGSQGNPNDLASASLLLPMAWLALPQPAMVAGYAVACCIGATVWIFSAGRQVAIGWAISSLVPFARRLGWRRALMVALAASIVIAAIVMLNPTLQGRLQETMHSGAGDREQLVAFGLWQWWQRPLFGNGPGTFGELYQQAVLSGWSWRGTELVREGMPWPHNLAVEVLSDLGLVGLIAFSIVGAGFWRRVRFTMAQSEADRRLRTVALTMMLAMLAVGMVDLSFIKDWFRCVFWIALGLGFAPPDARSPDADEGNPPKGS